MRNSDKIRILNNKLESIMRHKQKLVSENEALRAASVELKMITEAVIVSVVIAKGERRPNGSFTLALPKVDVVKNTDKYMIAAKAEGDMRVIVVKPKEDENGTGDKKH